MISFQHSYAIVPSNDYFNPQAAFPYGLTIDAVKHAMCDVTRFLQRTEERFDQFMEPATFSSMISGYLVTKIGQYSETIIKNNYHNGHPDLIPIAWYPEDRIQYGPHGIEVKASKHLSSWQGHNQEDVWLLVFCYAPPSEDTSFRFTLVAGAQLTKDDWSIAERGETSRRTRTASVTASGRQKMIANCIYCDPLFTNIHLYDSAVDSHLIRWT